MGPFKVTLLIDCPWLMKFVNIYWKTSQNSLETESQTDNDLEITEASKFLQILEKIQDLCDISQKQNV